MTGRPIQETCTITLRTFIIKFRYGVGMSMVEVDCLTGDFHVIKSHVLMDLGSALNPAIDIGQIEGAFIQGMGLFTMEQTLVLSATGEIFTRGPGNYKIPSFSDIPIEFNISLLKESKNDKAVFSSKAVGEPPLFLGASVLFAIRDAIKSARQESNLAMEGFVLNSPATAERIRMAIGDGMIKKVKDVGKKWSVALED